MDWDRIKRAMDSKKDAKDIEELEALRKHLPPAIQELLRDARPVPPSEIAADPHLSVVDELIRLKLEMKELDESYRDAIKMIGALVQTYGHPVGEPGDHTHQAFVSYDVVDDQPRCAVVEAIEPKDTPAHGAYIRVKPHVCNISPN